MREPRVQVAATVALGFAAVPVAPAGIGQESGLARVGSDRSGCDLGRRLHVRVFGPGRKLAQVRYIKRAIRVLFRRACLPFRPPEQDPDCALENAPMLEEQRARKPALASVHPHPHYR